MITGRPRKNGERKPSGRLRQAKPEKPCISTRMRDFGITAQQSLHPLAGYLVGVLFLRNLLDARALGGFYSFLQISKHTKHLRSASFTMRVQGGRIVDKSFQLSSSYLDLIKSLGTRINILHALERDQLIAPIPIIQRTLHQVPLTIGGYAFMHACESDNPTIAKRERGQQAQGH